MVSQINVDRVGKGYIPAGLDEGLNFSCSAKAGRAA